MSPSRWPRAPYGIFRSSRTPPGLYARQKWLGEASSEIWKADFDATVAELRRGQSADGLWAGSLIETIHRLFGLHLTVRDADAPINKGLDAMLAVVSSSVLLRDTDDVSAKQLRGLPFAPAHRQAVILPAVLFLAAIFGRASDPTVLRLYDQIASGLMDSPLVQQEPAVLHNILRALVVHPGFAEHAATNAIVDWLAGRQTSMGDWGPGIPFYQMVNALAHLNTPAADRQCESAIFRLIQIQDADGAWGEMDRQWCTFLAVHALRNKGMR